MASIFEKFNPYAPRNKSVISKTNTLSDYLTKNATKNSIIGKTTPVYKDYAYINQNDYINNYVKSLGITNSGGGYNLAAANNAYNQLAAADTAEVTNAINTQKQDLATQIARIRDAISSSKKDKTQAYQGTRADIEESGFMATRANRASAAARGLTGSGLEQLAQLQQMIKQNKTISTVANTNQAEQDALTKTLTQNEQDYGTNVNNLTKAQQIQLQKIQATLAANKTNAAQAAASASANANANYQSQMLAARENAYNQYAAGINTANAILNNYKATTNTKDRKLLEQQVSTAEQEGAITSDLAETLRNNINKYKQYKRWKY